MKKSDSKTPLQKYKNPVEALAEPGRGFAIAKDIEAQRKAMEQQLAQEGFEQEKPAGYANPEFQTVFTYIDHSETKVRQERIQEAQQLINEVKTELKSIKQHSDGLNAEIEQIERVALASLPDKPGVYHIHYLEIMLTYLRGLKAKVGEARTWMSAMHSKKAKRGSAFAAQSKKKGTQFSMSQELQAARNVQ